MLRSDIFRSRGCVPAHQPYEVVSVETLEEWVLKPLKGFEVIFLDTLLETFIAADVSQNS